MYAHVFRHGFLKFLGRSQVSPNVHEGHLMGQMVRSGFWNIGRETEERSIPVKITCFSI
jgi:hypothetical protein